MAKRHYKNLSLANKVQADLNGNTHKNENTISISFEIKGCQVF